MSESDPFAALGLPARADVTDDDVRAAWRRIAAATHPDRDDGGDPPRFAAAAAAYATLRTSFGRGEALADLAGQAGTARTRRFTGTLPQWLRWKPALARHPGQPSPTRRSLPVRWPLRLGVRLLAAAALGALAFAAAGWSPGTVAILVGAVTWLIALLLRDHRERQHRT